MTETTQRAPESARLRDAGLLMTPVDVAGPEVSAAYLRRLVAGQRAAQRMTILVRSRADLITRACSDPVAAAADSAQAAVAEGPAPLALERHDVVRTADLTSDPRWPALAAALPPGVRSALSVPLAGAGHPDWTVTAYAGAHSAFETRDAVDAVTAFAETVALALTGARWRTNAANLTVALESSRRIGAAVGILMSVNKITEEQAFELLRLTGQHCNRKLRDLAMDVIDTGWLDPALSRGLRHADQRTNDYAVVRHVPGARRD